MAMTLGERPLEALVYVARGLKLSPNHKALRSIAQQLVEGPEYAAARTCFEPEVFDDPVLSWDARPKAGSTPTIAYVEAWYRRYEEPVPDVLHDHSSPNKNGKDQEIIDVEAELSRFWMSMLPSREDPSWKEIAESLCDQMRFKARGSEAYLKMAAHT
jgi:hypothetical protein